VKQIKNGNGKIDSIIIIVVESYTEYNEKIYKNTRKKCIKHTHIDKSMQLTT